VIKPIVDEIRRFNESLDIEEFIASCLNLLKTVTVVERENLLNWKHKVSKDFEPKKTFHPSISKVSKAILNEDAFYSLPVE
jgi:hypothetical protein